MIIIKLNMTCDTKIRIFIFYKTTHSNYKVETLIWPTIIMWHTDSNATVNHIHTCMHACSVVMISKQVVAVFVRRVSSPTKKWG